ncbi:MAG TPA: alpha/beta hydrolase-fold protein [Pseudonocardiaceae bacterium]|jgi:enterochelin esterase-like enzyme|nr:alpha/beta hydrolase-fold protein [Pseudonocardiaceae bacterium]
MSVSPGPTLPPDVIARTLIEGPFESPVIWQLLLVAAAIAAYLLFRPLTRRRRNRIRSRQPLANRLVIVGALLGLAGAFWLNNYVGYVRTTHDLAQLLQRSTGYTEAAGDGLADITAAQDDYVNAAAAALANAKNAGKATPGSVADNTPQVLQVPIADPARGVPIGKANVMLPPGYYDPANAHTRYPVVYLLHGYPEGSPDDWFTSGDALNTMEALLADHVVQPMIVVAPDMTAEQSSIDWECLNIPGGPQLEDYLVDTVVPTIDHQFRTLADRQHRSLGGMSGGGFCTLNIGLQHLSTFSSLLISLPYDDLGDSAGILAGHPNLVIANDPRLYIPKMAFPQPISVLIAAGESAPTDVATAHRLTNALLARNQHVALVLQPGMTHTWRAARAALPYMLAYANQVFGRPPSQSPGKPNTLPAGPPAIASGPSYQAVPPPNTKTTTHGGGSHTTPHKGPGRHGLAARRV